MKLIHRKKSTATPRKNCSKPRSALRTPKGDERVVKPCSRAFAKHSRLDDLLALPLLAVEQEMKAKPEQLFAHNTKFALHQAAAWHSSRDNGDLDLYVNAALAGLWKAAKNFDPTRLRNGRFTSLATWYIRRELQLTKRSLRSGISIPVEAEQSRARFLAGEKLGEKTAKRVSSLLEPTSLDGLPLDRLGVDESPDAATLAARASLAREVSDIFATLPARFQLVLKHRLGLNVNKDPKTLAQLGKQLRVTRERVRQIEWKALQLFRRRALKAGLGSEALKLFQK